MSRKTKIMSFPADEEMYNEIDQRSMARGMRSMSAYIRSLIEVGLQSEKKQEEAAK